VKKAKITVSGGMRVRTYEVLRRCIEEGAEYGWMRAHKHTDAPDADAIKDQMVTAVLNAVSEYFHFDDDVQDPG